MKHRTCVDRKKALENPGGTSYAKSSRKVDEKNSEVYEKLFNTAYYNLLLKMSPSQSTKNYVPYKQRMG